MNSLAAWLAERRAPRVLIVAALFPFGLLGLLSASVVVMTAILKGWQIAVTDSLAALAVLFLVVLLASGNWVALLASAAPSWGSAILLGELARRHLSLTLSLQVLVLIAVAGVLAFALAVGDPVAFWRPLLETLAGQMTELGFEVSDPSALLLMAPLMSGLIAASAVISSTLALVTGAWWAAAAERRPFAPMFLRIRMGAVLGILTGLAGVAAPFDPSQLASSLLLVFGSGFAVQGLAVLHWQARARRWPWPILALIYAPLLFGPVPIALAWLVFACVGFVDNWFGLRRGDDADVI